MPWSINGSGAAPAFVSALPSAVKGGELSQAQKVEHIVGAMIDGVVEHVAGRCPSNWREVNTIPGTTLTCVSPGLYLSRDFASPAIINTPAGEDGKGVGENATLREELICKLLGQEALTQAVKAEFIRRYPGEVVMVNLNTVSEPEALKDHNTHMALHGIEAEKFNLVPGSVTAFNSAELHKYTLESDNGPVDSPVLRPAGNGFRDCLDKVGDLLGFFRDVFPLVKDKTVFVNCNQGLSRSSTFAVLLATAKAMEDQVNLTEDAVLERLSLETENYMNIRFPGGLGTLNKGFSGMMIHALDNNPEYFDLALVNGGENSMKTYAAKGFGYDPDVHGELRQFMKDQVDLVRRSMAKTIIDVVSDSKNTSGMFSGCFEGGVLC